MFDLLASRDNGASGNAADLNIASPPGAVNWGIGCVSDKISGDGLHESSGMHVFHRSLCEAQLSVGLGVKYF